MNATNSGDLLNIKESNNSNNNNYYHTRKQACVFLLMRYNRTLPCDFEIL